METLFRCPACHEELERTEHAYVCKNSHSFDIARQGYVHLLMPNKMHSKIPGDTKQMVDSRRDFLNLGCYDIFADELCALVGKYTECGAGKIESPVILDAGCGEGYYTSRIKKAVENAHVSGFDISKFAVKAAAGSYKNIEFAVASIFDIPVADGSCDCVVNVFAPIVEGEFLRVLKKGGVLIIAVPGERHLFEMKEILYENPYENEEKDTDYEGFEFLERVPVKGRIELNNNKSVWDLFAMTPYYWKTDVDGGERLRRTEHLSTEIHFDFLIYRKL
jgi:23S rRNA (guanine745-N1)-methyltransferase